MSKRDSGPKPLRGFGALIGKVSLLADIIGIIGVAQGAVNWLSTGGFSLEKFFLQVNWTVGSGLFFAAGGFLLPIVEDMGVYLGFRPPIKHDDVFLVCLLAIGVLFGAYAVEKNVPVNQRWTSNGVVPPLCLFLVFAGYGILHAFIHSPGQEASIVALIIRILGWMGLLWLVVSAILFGIPRLLAVWASAPAQEKPEA